MKKVLLTCALLLVGGLYCLQAQVDTTGGGKFTLSGYIDSYILTAFNSPKSGNLMGYGQIDESYKVGRAFDRLDKQFALGLVQLKMGYSNAKSDLVIDLTFGPSADLGNFGNTRASANLFLPGNNYVNQLYGTSAAIKQAYFNYRFTDKFSMTVGQFGTHIGYEVIDAPINYHYSLSNLFNNGPFYHIGAKATYAFSSKVSLMAGVVNNWDNLTDDNTQKSLISQLYLNPAKGWNVYLNWIGGYSDDTYLTTIGAGTALTDYTRNLFDLTTGYQITPKFYLGLNAAYGRYNFMTKNTDEQSEITETYGSTKPSWGGVAIYGNYAISDVVGIGVRYEHFQDKNYVRYIGTVNNSLTVTAPISLAAGKLILKPELRLDTSPDKFYENKSGEAINSQSTFGMAFIYKY
ncbi:MAG: porin [Microscillaceae bacterium]|nr:porin [Microscillaceae bacterium]